MIPTAPFGSTGHNSTRLIFGAAALGSMSQDTADAALAQMDAAGINHIDTAASYGESELRLAPFLADHGDRFYLATKTGERTADAARAELENSLVRLGVDSVDLIQLHNLVEPDEWEIVHGPGGALEALVAARDEGLVRAIGVTGHGTRIPGMHLRSLAAFPYDSVLFPYNFTLMQRPDYANDVTLLRAECDARGVAMQTIKSVARGRWADDHDGARHSWYEPLRDPDAIARAVAYVLANDDLFLNTSSDVGLMGDIVAAAQGDITAPADQTMEADAEQFDITALFDGAALERI